MATTSGQRIRAVLRKELVELRKNKMVIGAMASLPLIFVTLMLVMNALVPIDPAAKVRGFVPPPALAGLSAGLALRILLNEQFMFYQLLVPMILPTVIAAHSVIGEKQARTLEPLLATPVRTSELLAAKILAAVLPAVLLGWLSYSVALVGVRLTSGSTVASFLYRPMWSLSMLGVAPLLALFTASVAVCISSRVNDARTAQAISGTAVVPVIAAGMAVLLGKRVLTTSFVLGVAATLVPLDLLLLALAGKLFQRETILIRWR
jgi:ABC-2 type transport system permease protein